MPPEKRPQAYQRQSYVHEHYRRLPELPISPPRAKRTRLDDRLGIRVPPGVGKGVFDSGFGNVFEQRVESLRAESPDLLDVSPGSSPLFPGQTGSTQTDSNLPADDSDPFTDVTIPFDSEDVAESQRSILAMIRAEAGEAGEAGEVLLKEEDPDSQGEPYIADCDHVIEIKSEEEPVVVVDVIDCDVDFDESAIELEKAVARLEEAERAREDARRALEQAEQAFRRSIELTKNSDEDSASPNSEFSNAKEEEEESELEVEEMEMEMEMEEIFDFDKGLEVPDEPPSYVSDHAESSDSPFGAGDDDSAVPSKSLLPPCPPCPPVSTSTPRTSLGDTILDLAVRIAREVKGVTQVERAKRVPRVERAKQAKRVQPIRQVRQVRKRPEPTTTSDGVKIISHRTGVDSSDDMTSSSDDGTYDPGTVTESDSGYDSTSENGSTSEVDNGNQKEDNRLGSEELQSDSASDSETLQSLNSLHLSPTSTKKERTAKLETRKSLSLIYCSDGSERGSEEESGSETDDSESESGSDEEGELRVDIIPQKSSSKSSDNSDSDSDSDSDSESESDSGPGSIDESFHLSPAVHGYNDDSGDDSSDSADTSSSPASPPASPSTLHELDLSFNEAITEVTPLPSTPPPRRPSNNFFRSINKVQWWLIYPSPSRATQRSPPPKSVEALVDLCTRTVGKNTDRLPLQMIRESERGWDFWSKIWNSILEYQKDTFAVFVCFAAVFGKRAQFSCHPRDEKHRSKHVITSHHRLQLLESVLTVHDVTYLQSVLCDQDKSFRNNLILSCTSGTVTGFVLPALPRLTTLTVLDLRNLPVTNARLSTWINTLKRGEWPLLRAILVGQADSKTMKEFLQFPNLWYVGFEPIMGSSPRIRVGDKWYRCTTKDIVEKKNRWNFRNNGVFEAVLKTAVSPSPSSRLFARLKEFQLDPGVNGHVVIETCFGVDLEAGVEAGRQLPDNYLHLVRVEK